MRQSRRRGRENVVQFGNARKKAARKTLLVAFFAFLAVFGIGMAVTNLPLLAGGQQDGSEGAYELSFSICGSIRYTCVVDGDTIWLKGTKIRIADIDTPEISSPKCDSEYQLGIEARDRLRELLDERPFDIRSIGGRDADRYGRKLRVIVQRGRSVGDVLVEEGLARTWSGRREPWC